MGIAFAGRNLNGTLINRDSEFGPTENAMHNLSAAQSTGFCLSALIDQGCFEVIA